MPELQPFRFEKLRAKLPFRRRAHQA
jgi:hypothetical protein